MERGWKEAGLVVLGIVLHALYMLSIFDIYFKTPIVHGMEPVSPRIQPPAKRLVLFIADGLRADKFFEMDASGRYRAPFLRSVIREKGRWGVSHARPPTESRPGHVAIIAGFYEDPSAVTKGWKANPVEFDSIFNRSRQTIAFGSPDIVPMFCAELSNSHWKSYPHEYEDFATDASFLDEWSFEQLRDFLNRSKTDTNLEKIFDGDQLVIFLHLLGCDTNGHAHRPFSSIYLNNIEVVDAGVKATVELVERIFADQRTAYIFTADHGMSDKGSHGDGHPANTETPLVVWGSGVRRPSPASPEDYEDDDTKFVDQHERHPPTPLGWGLRDIERVDVNQGDIAPLMSTLLGLPCPMNSVGSLPVAYLDLNEADVAEAVFANAKQILNQFLQKSRLKQATSLKFKPYMPLADYETIVKEIRKLIDKHQYETAIESAQDFIRLSLAGLHYFQTYDWAFLMSTVTMGYLGWMIYVLLHIIKNYTSILSHPSIPARKSKASPVQKNTVRIVGVSTLGVCSIILMVEHAPVLYQLYLALALLLWTEILSDSDFLYSVWNAVFSASPMSFIRTALASAVFILILEVLVLSFFMREVYTGVFLVGGVVGAVAVSCNIPGLSMIPAFVWASCWFLSVFTLLPVQISDNILFVVGSGFVVLGLAFWSWQLDRSLPADQAMRSIVCGPFYKSRRSNKIFYIQQAVVVAMSTCMVWVSTSIRGQKRGLPLPIQLMNWFLAGISIILPAFSAPEILGRLTSIFLGFAPPFLLLSIGYEAFFYSALALALISWILVEATLIHSPVNVDHDDASFHSVICDSIAPAFKATRPLKLGDMTVALCFIVLINVAFFGTGNVASLASFEISSVYRFITVFSPYTMAALLLWKLLIPFILVTCAFSAVMKLLKLPRLGCYFVVMLFSDIMTIHFFFLVRNTGSWLEIGQSISHFGIMSAQVVFVLLLFSITNVFTRDIVVSPREQVKLT
ncbi:hypothetical protein KP509_37G037300 [Ceratopteris richardii]|uniref:GPI ethanolamine phosphate transferase 1 n=1 Tax=Ceratopteris richardii TaxID=49495 RepID=A0A8T2Q831_CERRI|nr:hypothetical protein KP509_37G037300 [Ceratopteris richardii]